LAAALSMVALMSFTVGGGTVMAAPGESPMAQTTLPAEVLQYKWVLEYLSNEDKSAGHDMTASQITLQFVKDGTLSGFAGCNNYSGSYTVSGQKMTIGPLASTQKACEQTVMNNETKYLQQLSTVNAYNVNYSKLELSYSNGANTMTFIPGSGGTSQGGTGGQGAANTLPADIVQTTWTLQYFNTDAQAAGHDVSSSNITLKFETDGTLHGSGGCNDYNGTYTVSNQQMTISALASTRKACEQAVMDQESLYFRLLPTVSSYLIDQGKLVLLYQDGHNAMTYISGGSQGGTGGQGGANSLPSDVLNVVWILQYFTNAAAQDVSSDHITITFAPDGTFSGSGGCNNYFGSYTVSGGQLTIAQNMGSTAMFCEQAVMAKESLYFRLLLSVNSYQITGGKLQLVYGSSSSNPNALTYVSASAMPVQAGTLELPPAVLETSWTLKSLDSNNAAAQDETRSGIMIKFEPDGTFYGFDGCNNFSGSYTVSGGKLTINENVASTMKACPELPTGTKFLQLLAAVKSFTLSNDNNQLSLDYQDTGSSLVFVRTTLAVGPQIQPVRPVGMPSTGGGTPLLILLLLASSLVALAFGFGLRRVHAMRRVRK
jgi:heat shock protein HslJ